MGYSPLLKNAHPLEPFLDMSLHGSKTRAWQRSNGVHLVRMENEKQKEAACYTLDIAEGMFDIDES